MTVNFYIDPKARPIRLASGTVVSEGYRNNKKYYVIRPDNKNHFGNIVRGESEIIKHQ